MRSIGLVFKVLWSPGEAMFLIARNPCFILPLSLLIVSSLVSGAIVMTKLPDLPMRAIERSPQGMNLSDEAKDRIREQINSPITLIFTIVFSGLRPLILLLIVSGIYFWAFTIVGREGSFRAFFSITTFTFVPTILRQI